MNRARIVVALLFFAAAVLALPVPCRAAVGSGDISGDGTLTMTDQNLLRDYLLDKIPLTASQHASADMNGDAKVDVADLVKMVLFLQNQGFITIDVTPDTGTWKLTGPAGFTTINGTGDRLGASAFTNAPAGVYTLHCNALTDYTAPADQITTLTPGGAIAFNPSYYDAPGGQTMTLTLPGGVPLVLVKCPAGSFQMGRPATEPSPYSQEGPVHTVNISKAFYMGKYEVTQAQWLAVMGSNPAGKHGVGDNYPVYHVSWNDIAGNGGFIEKLNSYLASAGHGTVRLPSEAEWEYTCRAGTTTQFYFGDSLTITDDNYSDGPTNSTLYPGNRSDYMWFWFNCQGNANGANGTKPVGTKRPNAFGLFDMSGNVWEWCQDWYSSSYPAGVATDPTGPVSGYGRVIRGGSWSTDATHCRSAFRNGNGLDQHNRDIGFRLARTY